MPTSRTAFSISDRTGIPELRRTTRDEPDYDKLMRGRLELLRRHRLGLPDIQKVIRGMGPLPGAKEFLDALRRSFQVVILSDTYYEFAMPLMEQLGLPTLFCHRLETDSSGAVTGYRLRATGYAVCLRGLSFVRKVRDE